MDASPSLSTPRFIAIMGYGAPKDPLTDRNLMVYLDAVTRALRPLRQHDEIQLMGGCTNRADLSEADAMWQWFEYFEPSFLPRLVPEDTPIAARDSIVAFAQEYSDYTTEAEFIIFCEYSRRWTIRMLVRKLFPGRKVWVCGIKFDGPSLALRHRLKQVGPKLLLEWAALRNERVEALRWTLRMRHIIEARQRYAESL